MTVRFCRFVGGPLDGWMLLVPVRATRVYTDGVAAIWTFSIPFKTPTFTYERDGDVCTLAQESIAA